MGLALLEKENRGMLVLDTPFIFTFVSGLHLTVITFQLNKSRRLTVQSVSINNCYLLGSYL